MLKALKEKVNTFQTNLTNKGGSTNIKEDKHILRPVDINDIEKPESTMGALMTLKCGLT